MSMIVSSSGGSFTVAENDRPDSPMATRRSNSTALKRVDSDGGLYNPVAYSFITRDFSFTDIRPSCVNNFKTLFGTASDFTVVDDDLGSLNLTLVPGSFRVAYGAWNAASCWFTAEDREASI
jgi:hypothetical protein